MFFDGGRQVIVLGEHPSSRGHYYWPAGMGPEALSAPPEQWWSHALQIAARGSPAAASPAQGAMAPSGWIHALSAVATAAKGGLGSGVSKRSRG